MMNKNGPHIVGFFLPNGLLMVYFRTTHPGVTWTSQTEPYPLFDSYSHWALNK